MNKELSEFQKRQQCQPAKPCWLRRFVRRLVENANLPTNNPGTGTKPKTWECLCDVSYYDMWCVRRIHERKFGQGFHINNGKEAQALTDLLNENEVA